MTDPTMKPGQERPDKVGQPVCVWTETFDGYATTWMRACDGKATDRVTPFCGWCGKRVEEKRYYVSEEKDWP